MNIKKIKLMRYAHLMDQLHFETDLPNGCFPYRGNAWFMMYVGKDEGEQYIFTHFPNTEYEIVNTY